MFGKYKLTQEEVNKINNIYRELKAENLELKLKAEDFANESAKIKNGFLYNKAKELELEVKDLKDKLQKSEKALRIANSTTSAVLEKLNEVQSQLQLQVQSQVQSQSQNAKGVLDILA